VSKAYYSNGVLKWEVPFTNGKIDGVKREYYENGKIKTETIFTNGVKGATKNYDENGNEIKQ
jgi:antitoxin component YwqK of YwqJK toxin-antitoxin module